MDSNTDEKPRHILPLMDLIGRSLTRHIGYLFLTIGRRRKEESDGVAGPPLFPTMGSHQSKLRGKDGKSRGRRDRPSISST